MFSNINELLSDSDGYFGKQIQKKPKLTGRWRSLHKPEKMRKGKFPIV